MSTVGSYRGPNIVTKGLVLHLDAASPNSYYSPNGGTVWKDVSGNGNDGTLVNGTTFADDSFDFDGSNDYILTGITQSFATTDFTLEAWVYPEFSSATYGRPIMTKNTTGGCGVYDFALEYGRNANKFDLIADGGSASPGLFSTSLSPFNWYHVVATRKQIGASTYDVKLFVNNNLEDSATGNYTGGNGGAVVIGAFGNCSPVGEWLGSITIANIYNRALTAQEVLQNFNSTKDRFGL